MNKEIKDFKDLKVGNKYLVGHLMNYRNPKCTEAFFSHTHKSAVDDRPVYVFVYISTGDKFKIHESQFKDCYIFNLEEVEDKSKPKEDKPLIEMRISGVDHLFNIPFNNIFDKLDDQTENEKSFLNLSLYDIISEGGTVTISKVSRRDWYKK